MALSKYPRGTQFNCLRCDRSWRSARGSDSLPKACGKCKTAYWDRPPQKVPHASTGVGSKPK